MSTENDPDKPLPDLVLDIDCPDTSDVFSNIETSVWSGRTVKNGFDLPTSCSAHSNKLENCKQLSDEQTSGKIENRVTPRRAQFSRGASKSKNESPSNVRPCEQHTFLTDITEVRQMEQGLLQLLDDFHLGKLQAFGKNCTFEKMEQVREQQERLARVHFELNAQQEIPQSEDARRLGRENLRKLIDNLQQLSRSIEQLQISNSNLQTDV
ncbi:coiled-coil domain-containing protein 28A [Parasteatoda tepidariorum]|nr:coiled-coil domain-containing protein 28A [Parasteatoda tepidariorum]